MSVVQFCRCVCSESYTNMLPLVIFRGQRSDSERHRRELESMLSSNNRHNEPVPMEDNSADVDDDALELLGECDAALCEVVLYRICFIL